MTTGETRNWTGKDMSIFATIWAIIILMSWFSSTGTRPRSSLVLALLYSSTLQNFSCIPMIPTNDFLQEQIYSRKLHLGKNEFYSGFSHGELEKMKQKTGIRSCNIERESSIFLFWLSCIQNLPLFGRFVKIEYITCARTSILMAFLVNLCSF